MGKSEAGGVRSGVLFLLLSSEERRSLGAWSGGQSCRPHHDGAETGEGGDRRNKVLPRGRERIPGFRAHQPQQRSTRCVFPPKRGERLSSPCPAREESEFP